MPAGNHALHEIRAHHLLRAETRPKDDRGAEVEEWSNKRGNDRGTTQHPQGGRPHPLEQPRPGAAFDRARMSVIESVLRLVEHPYPCQLERLDPGRLDRVCRSQFALIS